MYADSTRRSVIVTPMSDHDDKVSPKEVFHFGDTTISDLVVDWVSDNIYWTNQTSHGRFLHRRLSPFTLEQNFYNVFLSPRCYNNRIYKKQAKRKLDYTSFPSPSVTREHPQIYSII